MKPNERRAQRPSSTGIRQAPFLLRDTGDGSDGDGWTLDGYGAVFNTFTTIDSWEGMFREQIANRSMARSFRETPPIVQFDHGRHPLIGSFPIAELLSAREETDPDLAPEGGAHIQARIFQHLFFEPLREALAAQAIKGMSFRFEVVREKWAYADGTPIKNDDDLIVELRRTWSGEIEEDDLPIRTLQELKVPEIGPVVWPAYSETSVGVRNQVINLSELDSDEDQRIALARKLWAMPKTKTRTGKPATPPTRDKSATRDDTDPNALAQGLDATLDQAFALLEGVDTSTLPEDVAQACALVNAAQAIVDNLLDAMGVFDADDTDDDAADDEAGEDDADDDADDDPDALAASLDAVLDEASKLIADVDTSTLPTDVAQACALIIAAEAVVDDLLDAMGVYDADDDDDSGRSKNVDAQASRKKDAQQVADRIKPGLADKRPSRSNDAQRTADKSAGKRPSTTLVAMRNRVEYNTLQLAKIKTPQGDSHE